MPAHPSRPDGPLAFQRIASLLLQIRVLCFSWIGRCKAPERLADKLVEQLVKACFEEASTPLDVPTCKSCKC